MIKRLFNRIEIGFCIILCFLFLGCAAKNKSLGLYYKDHFRNVSYPDRKQIKESSISRELNHRYKEVWDEMIAILVQRVIFIETKESNMIFCLLIEGVYFDKKFTYMEFPMVFLFEELMNGEVTKVHIYPMISFFEKNESEEVLAFKKLGYSQKGNELLEQLSVQLSANKRWPWLSNSGN